MDTTQLLALHDRHQRIELNERGMIREVLPEVVRHVNEREDGEGMVIYSHLDARCADRVIAEQIARFRTIGQDFEWKVYGHDAPADLRERLLRAGFEAEEPEALLVLDLEEAPAELLRPVTLDIRRIDDPARLDDIHVVQRSVWGESDPCYVDTLKNDLAQTPDRVGIFIAYADGGPVSYGRITYQDGNPFAGLWGGSTLADYRGRGFYTALLALRLQEARGRGIRFLTIDASPMSRPIVEKHGFRFLTMTQPFKWHVNPTGETS